MKRKGWLTILLLIALLLMLGGVRRSESADQRKSDPVRSGAESIAAIPGRGTLAERTSAARENPLWLLQINAESQSAASQAR